MGMYDSVFFKTQKGEDIDLQFKSGECCLRNYEIGDTSDFWDGIHFDYEGCIVVKNHIIIAAFAKEDAPFYNKWGEAMTFPDISPNNPITKYLNDSK